MPLGDILDVLRDAYCRTIGVEYMHIQEPDQKRGSRSRSKASTPTLDADEQRHILDRLNAAEAFEQFLSTKYVGPEALRHRRRRDPPSRCSTPCSTRPPTTGFDEAVMGMAHRGRLNVLANIVGKRYGEIFREFEGNIDPETTQGSGDVKYHQGAAGKFVGRIGQRDRRCTLASNPSHLEAVDPVVEGMARAKQDLHRRRPDGRSRCCRSLIHGDAAFAGQGVVAETLNLSALQGYRTGGTIHLVINNQLGFTTAPDVGPLVGVRHRRGQDGPGADLPRERRRPRGLRAGGPAGLRLPPGVPQGRRHRHGVLPAPRPQRGRRPELHPAAHVQADRRTGGRCASSTPRRW